MLDLADLEAHLSHELVCPVNLINTDDVYRSGNERRAGRNF
jgi:hypothetical protein